MRRWFHEPPEAPAGGRPLAAAQLVAECRRTYTEITTAGGATIDTPLPFCGPHPLAARTVVQPDGDVICLVDPWFLHDAALRLAHQRRVEERLAQLRGTVDQVGGVVRAASLVGGAAVGAATGAFAGILGGPAYSLVGFALSFVTVPLFREGMKAVLRRALRRIGPG